MLINDRSCSSIRIHVPVRAAWHSLMLLLLVLVLVVLMEVIGIISLLSLLLLNPE